MWVWLPSHNPINFRALNANSLKIAKDVNFKFGTQYHRDSPDMTPEIFFVGSWSVSRDPLNFWALSANSFNMVKALDFELVPTKHP